VGEQRPAPPAGRDAERQAGQQGEAGQRADLPGGDGADLGFDMSAAGGDPATDMTPDELASLARTVLSGFTATQHRACNVLATVDGDIAHCRAMVDAWHTVPTDPGIADFYTARNNWMLRLERVDGRWLITKWTIATAAPSDGYQGVDHVAQARAAQDQAQ
jgi:hypothetical protein